MIAPRMGSFEDDTAVTPVGASRFGCIIDPSWRVITGPNGMAVPTLDLTVHLRRPLPRPADWVLGRYFTRTVGEGLLEEDAELFDTQRRLLAQSRQLALSR